MLVGIKAAYWRLNSIEAWARSVQGRVQSAGHRR